MNCSSPHIPNCLPFKISVSSSVHDASVIPDDEIPRVFPFDGTYIFGLRCVFVQVFEQFRTFIRVHVFNVMRVGSNVQILDQPPNISGDTIRPLGSWVWTSQCLDMGYLVGSRSLKYSGDAFLRE